MGDLNQPYSCTQWGNVAASGMPLITDDTGLPIFGLFHTDNLLPSAVYIDHTMTVHYQVLIILYQTGQEMKMY